MVSEKPVKRVVSVSIGSSKRDHFVDVEFLGEKMRLERIGTDGDMQKAVELIRDLDGKVAAIGLGGIDLYVIAGDRRYIIKDAKKLADAAKKTPVVDGSGLKNTLEREAIQYLARETTLLKPGTKVLLVSAVDRFGMAQAVAQLPGVETIFGDFIFGLKIPIPIRTIGNVNRLARLLLPIITRMPFEKLYPTGDKQESVEPKFEKYYYWADVIAGDFHFIRRFMPEKLKGKTIITNTVTQDDVEILKLRGIDTLVTTTPELKGRSFGTNVFEAMFVALLQKRPEDITPQEYLDLLRKINLTIRVEKLVRL